jgi:hypothetical protein
MVHDADVLIPRSVESPHYHVWTDALHARHLVHRASNAWDRGSYVRWAVNTAWTAFEVACQEATGAKNLGERFKDHLNEEFDANGIPRPDWGTGLWQQVLRIYGLRKDYVHGGIPQARLFAPEQEADEAISILRRAIQDVFHRVGQAAPLWVEDDTNPEMPQDSVGHLTVARVGADPSDPARVRIVYEFQEREYESEVLPPETDPESSMDDLLRTITIPITAVRAYRGDHELINEWKVRMRGT